METKLIERPIKPCRPTIPLDLGSTFNLDLSKEIIITAFAEPGPLTPSINPNFIFSKIDLQMIMMALANGENIYVKGPSGTGKTEMINQIAARLNYNLLQINFDGHLLRSDFIGEPWIVGKETKFKYGLLPFGFEEPGTIILLDEVDACTPETAFVMQRALSHQKSLLLHETNELVFLHPQNAIIATANTVGGADETSNYIAGTYVQNFSFINRFDIYLDMTYLSVKQETELLEKLHPGLEKAHYQTVATIAKQVRDAFAAGEVSTPLTTRDVTTWVKKMTEVPKPLLTAEYAFLNRMSLQEAMTVAAIIQHNWTKHDGDSVKFIKDYTPDQSI